MKRYLLLLLLFSCAPDTRLQGAPCKTAAGVRLFGSNDCTGLQVAEDRAVVVYSKHYVSAIDSLYGFVLYIQPAPGVQNSWQSPAGKTVRGLTWCRQQVIQIGSADWKHSSYCHELLHAIECGEWVTGEDPDLQWEVSWQPSAIEECMAGL